MLETMPSSDRPALHIMGHAHLYRRDLHKPFPPSRWPEGISRRAFTPMRAREVHALLIDAYRNGGGSVPNFAEWWHALSTDAEYEPELVRLACTHDGTPVGVALCWSSAFIKDLGVIRSWQHRGVGRSLLVDVFAHFAARGGDHVDLKVEADNARAIALYESLGFTRQPAA
jgi:ribosomal protein S18 acetylase RimI-like enzyme